jgi:hypothetical protein
VELIRKDQAVVPLSLLRSPMGAKMEEIEEMKVIPITVRFNYILSNSSIIQSNPISVISTIEVKVKVGSANVLPGTKTGATA